MFGVFEVGGERALVVRRFSSFSELVSENVEVCRVVDIGFRGRLGMVFGVDSPAGWSGEVLGSGSNLLEKWPLGD